MLPVEKVSLELRVFLWDSVTCRTFSQGLFLVFALAAFLSLCVTGIHQAVAKPFLRHEHSNITACSDRGPESFNVMFFWVGVNQGITWPFSGERQCCGCWQRGTDHVSNSCIIHYGNRSWNSSSLLSPCSQDKLSLALERVELQSEEATFFQKQTNGQILLIKVRGSEFHLAENLPLPSGTHIVCPCGTSRTCILTCLPVLDDKAVTDEPPCCVTSCWLD